MHANADETTQLRTLPFRRPGWIFDQPRRTVPRPHAVTLHQGTGSCLDHAYTQRLIRLCGSCLHTATNQAIWIMLHTHRLLRLFRACFTQRHDVRTAHGTHRQLHRAAVRACWNRCTCPARHIAACWCTSPTHGSAWRCSTCHERFISFGEGFCLRYIC